MDVSLTISTPATSSRLTELTTAQGVLAQIESSKTDDQINALIDRASDTICRYLNWKVADDGTVSLGVETIVETITPDCREPHFWLSRRPVISITSVTEDGDTVDAADYQLVKLSGKLYRLESGVKTTWLKEEIIVTYQAGWALPGANPRTLPHDIEQACLELIQHYAVTEKVEPGLRSKVLPGLVEKSFFPSLNNTKAGLPITVKALLEPYVRPIII